ncbi:glycosyltransferase family 2 protein [Butyrivibrio sp. VCB2006]|uniref:glycosyltransferase family 2 protein n=1 Tax=Butyrivibrio sp. VCB2006 TaxID=1280679 RepID=UPI000424E1F3|nr:glycosyltransferase family 2 protein [Butyrivibrio sp. VCB2006]
MNDSKVSIVVAVYNGEPYIDDCVKGILSQTYENIECIMVDDGSTDKSGIMLDEYSKKDARIRVVHQANGGLSAARNAGTKAATGEYIVFFDVDDTVTDKVIEDNVSLAIANNADVVMFGFWYYNVDTDVKTPNHMPLMFVGGAKDYFDNYLITSIDHEVFNAPWNKLYKMSFLQENGLHFYEEYPIYEDIIFASKMFQYADKIVVNNKLYYTYYVKSSGSLITKFVDGYFDSVTRFYRNAIDYCNLYQDNFRQKKRFSSMYLRLVTTNLKQISCKKSLSLNEKLRRIKTICDSEDIEKALELSNTSGKRRVILRLIQLKQYCLICFLYNIKNVIDGKKMS